MVMLPQVYNTADLPDTGGVVLIPEGQYKAVILSSEMKPTSNGNGQFLALKIVITEGPHRDTEFVERLNVINPNQTAVEIAYRTLARISEAVGMTQTPSDSAMLHNKPFMIDVGTEAGTPYKRDGVEKMGKDKSIIKKYHPMPAVGFAGKPAFAQAAPQQAAPMATAAPQSAPWK